MRRIHCSVLRQIILVVGAVGLILLSLIPSEQQPLDSWAGVRWSPLTISGLAGPAPPRPLTSVEVTDCLRRRSAALGRDTRITFIGNSRARQVFETVVRQRALRLLTRAETDGRSPFADEPLRPDWRHFAEPNTTCVGVWPKGRPKGEPARAWCSQLAVGNGLELEFRWRNAVFRFVDALRRLERGCARGSACPDVIVINQGLHFLVSGRFGRLLPIFREYVMDCVPWLRQLTGRGVKVVWMFEHTGNPQIGAESYNDDTLVLNVLIADLFAGKLRMPGLYVWTSEASAVARYWSRTCTRLLHRLTAEEQHVCLQERYHVNNGTLEVMADQLMNFVCDSAGSV